MVTSNKTTKGTKTTQKTSTVKAKNSKTSKAQSEPFVLNPVSTLTPNTYITVRNGFNGKLVYKSKRTGERFVWDEFGSEQEMELSELKAAKNSYKQFFIHNWFLFDDPAVIDYLGVSAYYKNALSADEFDNLLNKSTDEISEIIAKLSKGQKKSLIYRIRQLVENDKIDSLKLIKTLESSLNIDLSNH